MILWQSLCVITVVFSLESSGSILWPAGKYGIPKPVSGCPRADGFRWKTGWRLQDTNYYDEHNKSNNSRSPEFHIDGKVTKIIVNRSFCMKVVERTNDVNKNRPTWPQGKYCIYRKGYRCPEGMKSGWVFWEDDEDMSWNGNEQDGTLPDGRFDYFTEIKFCCRTDGDKNDPILLPTKSPFFLLAYESAKCQVVKWAVASLEWIYYFTNDWDNGDQRNGSYPYNAGKMHPTIYYCYYQGCNKTITAVIGTFQSPNFPRKYPDGQYCSWRIMVNTAQQIHLKFKEFSLQNEKDTDELYVYDGEDSTGKVLGVFYGGHRPSKNGIFSSSNRMFLIFKSDNTDSYTGFSASYFAYKNPVPSVTTANTHTLGVSPPTTVTMAKTMTTQIPEELSSPILTSGTSKALKVTVTTTMQISDITSSSVVTATTGYVKASKVTPSSATQAPEVTSLSPVISTNTRTLKVTHSPPITSQTLHTLTKATPNGEPWTSTTKTPQKKGCNETLTAVNGTFQSPNFPRKYPDGQYCSWRIMVNSAQRIYLLFTSFTLQNEKGTDKVYVYDGENATGEVLGVFNASHPPPKAGICFSSNRIFVLFKSDKADSYHGFRVSYNGVNISEPCAMNTTAQTTPGKSTSGPPKEGGKKDKSFKIAVVIPVVSVVIVAILLVAGICYCKRKKWKRLLGQDDAIYLRLSPESIASEENTEL